MHYHRFCLLKNLPQEFPSPEIIGIIPNGGYRRANKQSAKAIKWLLWVEREIGVEIQHAARSREFRLPEGTPVDGYYIDGDEKRHVLQFNGCFWHGCVDCYKLNRDEKLKSRDTIDMLYENTRATSEKIRKACYVLTEIWECKYDKFFKNSPGMNKYFENHPLLHQDALNPREAFFGGRKGNTVYYYKIKNYEKIRYIDVGSLYPFISKMEKFPIGQPKIYVSDEECKELADPNYMNLHQIDGLFKCRVLPPRHLFHPVLPVQMHGKLMFPLCHACCASMSQTECSHDDTMGELEGTWVLNELKEAMALNYREASGWPSECVDAEAKQDYLREHDEIEGIDLDPEQISKNPGLRSVAKLCLNSFWGKFGQRENLPQTEVLEERKRLMELFTSPEEEASVASPYTNLVIAAYTTAQARLKLFECLYQLDRRVLYYDTDSCIYICHKNLSEYNPPMGRLLGQMTDELKVYVNWNVYGQPICHVAVRPVASIRPSARVTCIPPCPAAILIAQALMPRPPAPEIQPT
ncbi:uncharacterized protein LOC117178722 [Belonocnema kinseyi]|uniref:uncharacterized protein LOC117178722 n=1 Tax=Belonocnema kinseyi TaxID=2817044 RepID=UPI00143D4B6B|nr:uncharacterized protein LOC117178722 [Belonocnema kinseyi]